MSTRIRLLAWVHIVLGALGLLAAGTVLSWLSANPDTSSRFLISLGWMSALATAVWFVPMMLGGWGMLRGRRWARWMLWVEAVLLLVGVPIGTALGAFTIWALLSEPQEGRPTDFRTAGRKAMLFLVALGVLGAMIGLGYLFRDQLESGVPKIVPVLIGLVVLGVIVAFGGKGRAPVRTAATRIASVRTIPAAAPINYDLDKTITATCEHLAPIERAMRDANVRVKLVMDKAVDAWCLIEPDALFKRFGPARSVTYTGDYRPTARSHEGPPSSVIACSACGSWIVTCHKDNAGRDTPVFPASRS